MKDNSKVLHYYNGDEPETVEVEIHCNRTKRVHCYVVPSYYVAENMFIEKYKHHDYKITKVEKLQQ